MRLKFNVDVLTDACVSVGLKDIYDKCNKQYIRKVLVVAHISTKYVEKRDEV
jgi:hypothetical protein